MHAPESVSWMLASMHNEEVLMRHSPWHSVLGDLQALYGGTVETGCGDMYLWPRRKFASETGISAHWPILAGETKVRIQGPHDSPEQARRWVAACTFADKLGSLTFTGVMLGPFPTNRSQGSSEAFSIPDFSTIETLDPSAKPGHQGNGLFRVDTPNASPDRAYVKATARTLGTAASLITTEFKRVFPDSQTPGQTVAAWMLGVKPVYLWEAIAVLSVVDAIPGKPLRAAQYALKELGALGE